MYPCSCQNAMKVMCFTEEEIADVLQVIAGVLQLGNVNFMAAGGAQVAEKSGKYMQETETDDFYFCVYSVPFCLKAGWSVVLAMQQGKSDVLVAIQCQIVYSKGLRKTWMVSASRVRNKDIDMNMQISMLKAGDME